MNTDMTPTKISYKELSPEALQGVIEQFISRDGPDSGHVDITFKRKVEQVMQKLKTGKAIILYDGQTQSCNIFPNDDPMVTDLLI
jgi:uncharacterized protein YheU (UPF0270 family)